MKSADLSLAASLSDIAVSVNNLSKSYMLGHNSSQVERYTALRDVFSRNARNLLRKSQDMLQGRSIVQGDEVEEFWALENLSFEVKRGEVLGIIGRNGAGKSTLLKILSRITEPTCGRIRIAGRVASLLEVGTGFHPELSGRENVFLNGAILGMHRQEIQQKFDEIVEFSGVEKFIDTPVKRYSSGMYVRLAFAVAAHLESEVLIVDEVLAVGDAEFQKKCLKKMGEVGKTGRTVLFVSHNLAAVQLLCSSAIYLSSGTMRMTGDCGAVIEAYLATEQFEDTRQFPKNCGGALRIMNIATSQSSVKSGHALGVNLELEASEGEIVREIALLISSSSGERVAIVDLRRAEGAFYLKPGEVLRITVDVKRINLVEGRYSFGVYISSKFFTGNVMDLTHFGVVEQLQDQPRYPANVRGVVSFDCEVTYESPSLL